MGAASRDAGAGWDRFIGNAGKCKAGKGNFNSQRFRSGAARNQPREGCCRSRLSDNPMLASENENDGWKPSLDGGEKVSGRSLHPTFLDERHTAEARNKLRRLQCKPGRKFEDLPLTLQNAPSHLNWLNRPS
jgi:hypothetical protein